MPGNTTPTGAPRNTFLSVAECLRGVAARCEEAAQHLEGRLDELHPPYRDAYAEMAAVERELVRLLRGYADAGPEAVLATRVQFNPDISGWAEPGSPGEALKRLEETNAALTDNLKDQVRNTIPPGIAAELQTLWGDVDALGRRISLMHTTLRDN